jgi:4-alpha-glucanotransferase
MMGFGDQRIRWLSKPHIPTGGLRDAAGSREDADIAASLALDRIGNEVLWLFKPSICGENDIASLGLGEGAKNYLLKEWSNISFIEYQKDSFVPAWNIHKSRSWSSLSENEKLELSRLIETKKEESEKIWEKEGQTLLSMLTASSSMLPCAEDLGAVPDCVPKVLKSLNILGLSVVRWSRLWEKEGQPYIPFANYRPLSVCTPSVHDSSTLREWWEKEADQAQFVAFVGSPALGRVYNPGIARVILLAIAGAASRFRVFQFQDLLHLSSRWYAPDAASERINVPGTVSTFNWTWRMPASIEEISEDKNLLASIRELASVKPAQNLKMKV